MYYGEYNQTNGRTQVQVNIGSLIKVSLFTVLIFALILF